MNRNKWMRDAILAQFGTELAAGMHQEFPALRQLWIEGEAARAEELALRYACEDVVSNTKYRMD